MQRLGIHPLDPPGVEKIDAAQDAGGMGDDGIGIGGAQIDGGEALHHIVENLRGGLDRELERRLIGDAGAVGIRDGHVALGGELLDLRAGAMHEDDLD